MKKLLVWMSWAVMLLILTACQSSPYFNLELKSQVLKEPVKISGAADGRFGAIFYQVDTLKTYLPNKADSEKKTSAGTLYQFKMEDGRTVSLYVEKQGDDYLLHLTADKHDDILKWGVNIKAADKEYFTGLYERTVDGNQKNSWKKGVKEAMNLRGQEVEMLIKPTLGIYAPFYISSKGYGFFAYGTWPGHFDFCKAQKDLVQIAFEGPEFKFKIYTADNPAGLVKKHALEAGPPILPPKWIFKPWRWRDDHKNLPKYYDGTKVRAPYNSQVVEDVLMMRAYDIPCGIYWVDRPWAKGHSRQAKGMNPFNYFVY